MPSRLRPLVRARARIEFVTLIAVLTGLQAVPLRAQTSAGLVGDVNGDGAITAVDALAILSHVVGRPVPAGYRVSPNGDNNRDGQITAADALLALSFSVGRDVSQYPVGKPIATVPSRTIVVDSTTMTLLSDSAQYAAGVLRFRPSAGAPTVAAGNVLVGEQGGGFLVRVDSVRSGASGEIIVHSRPAALTDAVEDGWFRSSVRIGTGGAALSQPAAAPAAGRFSNVRWGPSYVRHLAPGASLGDGRLSLENVVFNGDGWTSMRIVSGFVDFTPEVELGAEIKGFALTSLDAVATGKIEYEAQLEFRTTTSVSDDVEVTLASYARPFMTTMGPVPVVGEVRVELVGVLEGEVRHKQLLRGGVRAEHSLSFGGRYASGEWFSVWEPRSTSSALPFRAEHEADMRLHFAVRPVLRVVLFGLGGPSWYPDPYLDLRGRINLTTGRWWRSAIAGIDGWMNFTLTPRTFPFSGAEITAFEDSITGPSTLIYADSGDLVLDSVRIAQRTPRVSPGGTLQLSLLRYWGDELVEFGPAAKWSSSDPALLGMSSDGKAQAGPNKGSGQVMVEVPAGPGKVLRDAVPVRVADPEDDDDEDGDEGQNPPGCNSCGDVHIRTPDGLAYDFQGAGEYLLMRSSDGSVVVQGRQEPWQGSDRVSINTAVAMNVAGDRVGVYLDRSPQLYVNGVPTASSGRRIDLPKGGAVFFSGGTYVIRWPNGFRVSAVARVPFLDLGMLKPAGSTLSYAGLLGNMNGVPGDDFFTKSGEAVPQPIEFAALYDVFGASWQITQAESLFDYDAGEGVATYAMPDFPRVPLATEDLNSEVFAAARSACLAAGVTDPVVLNDCILDFGATGNSRFVESATDAPAPEGTVRVKFPEGLIGSYYAGHFASDPNFHATDSLSFFATRTPVFSRVDNPIDFMEWPNIPSSWGVENLPGLAGHDAFTIVWRGRLIVPRSGTYYVRLSSWGPSYLFMDNTADDLVKSNSVVRDDWFGRDYKPLELTAGSHPITIVYAAQKGSGSYVNLSWYSPELGLPQPELITSLGRRVESPPQSLGP